MNIVSQVCKPHKFESLKPNFTDIRGLSPNFVGCEYFLESKSPDAIGSYV